MTAKTCVWTGASGTEYEFHVYERHPSITEGQMGNYIYAKVTPENKWRPVYIGQGDLGVRCTESHHQIECIDSKGATHVHLKLTDGGEKARRAVERDLLEGYPQAYAPKGCNQKEGG